MVIWLDERVTVAVPHEMFLKLKRHKEIKWGAVARDALMKYLEMIERAKSYDGA
jgi:hypothetical protein